MTHLAVVGTGYWGQNHARVGAELLDDGEISTLTLCDAAEDRVAEIADRYGVEYTTDHHDLTDRSVDAAVVATPSPTHHEIGTDLLESETDLLIEKPLALTSEEAVNLVKCADDHDRTLATGHIFRYHSALRELASRVDRGELGSLRYLSTNRHTFRTPRSKAGALHSLAVHDVDLYTQLFDDTPDRIYCETNSFIREDIDETATLLLTFGDATAVINVSWQVPVFGKRRDLAVVGSKRAAYVDYTEETQVELFDAETFRDDSGRYVSRNNGSIRIDTEQYEPLKREVEDFLQAREGSTTPSASGRVGANAVALIEQAIDSATSGQAVTDVSVPFPETR